MCECVCVSVAFPLPLPPEAELQEEKEKMYVAIGYSQNAGVPIYLKQVYNVCSVRSLCIYMNTLHAMLHV